MIHLEIYSHDMERDPFAGIVCNAVPRVGERILLLDGETDGNRSGRYRVLYVEHVLDERRVETVQQVCLVVIPEKP